MKALLIAAAVVAALLAALWAFAPLVLYSLLAFVLSLVFSAIAPLANMLFPSPEQRMRVEVSIVVDGQAHRAAAVTSCQELFEAYGPEHANFGRRARLNGGYVTVDLPDGRLVQSSAIDTCSEKDFAARAGALSFYLIDRRNKPARAWATSADRSAQSGAAPFRVVIVSVGPTADAPTDPARRSALPGDIRGPRAIEDIQTRLTSYVALSIPREIWSAEDRLRAEFAAIAEFRAVPRPDNNTLARLVRRTDALPASSALAPDHSRIDLPNPDRPPVAIEYVELADTGYTGRRDLPVPRACLAAGPCVLFPVFGSEVERVHTRKGYFFDPQSQRLIAVQALFAGVSAVTKAGFLP